VRGIRLALARRDLLTDQLAAIARVAVDHPVDVMFPMVTTVDELLTARGLLDDAVRAAGRGAQADLRVGIMVEVPATALKAAAFAPHVDFLSIGTNDLTQYALAAERGNAELAALADPLDPGVLTLIGAAGACSVDGVLVAVCGELAGDEHQRAHYHGDLRDRMRSSPLMDATRFALGLEATLRLMWLQYRVDQQHRGGGVNQ